MATAVPMTSTDNLVNYAKTSTKSLNEQIDVVAEFYAHKIHPQRIAYRTGVDLELVTQLVTGTSHQRLFKMLLARHKKARRDLRLKKSMRYKGIAQAEMQDKIELEYQASLTE